jgi:hypothetical protein
MTRWFLAWLLVAGLVGLAGAARAAESDVYCQTGTSSTGSPIFQPASQTNPCPVTSSGSGGGSVTYAAPPSASVGTTSAVLIAAGTYKQVIQIQTLPSGTCDVFFNPAGGTAIAGQGAAAEAPSGGGSFLFSATGPVPLPTGNLTAITDGSGACPVMILGY